MKFEFLLPAKSEVSIGVKIASDLTIQRMSYFSTGALEFKIDGILDWMNPAHLFGGSSLPHGFFEPLRFKKGSTVTFGLKNLSSKENGVGFDFFQNAFSKKAS